MISSGYDLIMIIWGLIFVAAASGFIVVINQVFQFEERRQDALVGTEPTPLPSPSESQSKAAV